MSCKGELTADSSLELQPSEKQASTTIATTSTDSQDSSGWLLKEDQLSQCSVETQSLDGYSYPYSDMRHSSRNQHCDSRPSSVPPDRAPDPPTHEYLEPKTQASEQSGASISDTYTLPMSHETTGSARPYETIPGDDTMDYDYDDNIVA